MNRRSAVTLTEVLIAIFIMALGLMSILALFPLGAVQMAQALKDQQCADAAATAATTFRMSWKDANEAGTQGMPTTQQRFIIALTDPNQPDPLPTNTLVDVNGQPTPNPQLAGLSRLQFAEILGMNQPNDAARIAVLLSTLTIGAAPLNSPSYPVFVDSVGWQAWGSASNAAQQWWVGLDPSVPMAGPVNAIPRRPLYVRNQNSLPPVFQNLNVAPAGQTATQRVLRLFSSLDDMNFAPDGTAQTSGGMVQRLGKYSWAYMVRRSNSLMPRQVDLAVVVYSGRSIDVPSQERPFQVAFDATNPTTISIPYAAPNKPALRRGAWVLDATVDPTSGAGSPQGFFYRVVNVNDDTPGQVQLELQTSVRGPTSLRTFVVMDNVVEVFEKGTVDPKEETRPY